MRSQHIDKAPTGTWNKRSNITVSIRSVYLCRTYFPIRLISAAVIVVLPIACRGQVVPNETSLGPSTSLADYAGTVWNDATYTFSSPVRWNEDDWLVVGVESAAVAGTAAFLDPSIKNYAQRHQGDGLDHLSNHFEKFGAEYSFGVMGAFYLEGLLAHDDLNRVVGEDALAASIISGSITYLFKEAVGRSRPSAHQGTYHFKPFSGSASFPSGHATQAFAVASVIAARYNDKPWVDILAYGSASLVGMARIYHNAHFASDVLAGALIGNGVGRLVVRHRTESQRSRISFAPVAAPNFTGLEVSIDY